MNRYLNCAIFFQYKAILLVTFAMLFLQFNSGICQIFEDSIPSINNILMMADDPHSIKRLPKLARELAVTYGLKAIPQLVNAILENPLKTGEQGQLFATIALIEIIDPIDRYALKSASNNDLSLMSAPGYTIASISTLDREKATAWLWKISVEKKSNTYASRSASFLACGFLRYLGDGEILEKVKTIVHDTTSEPQGDKKYFFHSLLASLEYRLNYLNNEKDQQAFQEFEKQLWWSLALAPKGHAGTGYVYWQAAKGLYEKTGAVYPQFLIRILDEPTSSSEEKRIAFFLIVLQKETSLMEKIKVIAESKSPDSDNARWVLERLEKLNKD